MTERIEEAANEIRPLVEEFIIWADQHAPEADAELMGPAALWHRLVVSDNAVHWTREQLREVLLERYPRAVEDPRRAVAGTLPAVRAYLTFLSDTGRLRGEPLDVLLPELRAITPDFGRAVLEQDPGFGPDDWDDEDWIDDDENWSEWGEIAAAATLGDFADFADELEELTPIRLAPEPELAAAARGAPMLNRAWEYVTRTDELSQCPEEGPWHALWHLAVEAGFLDPMAESLTELAGDWPDVSDQAAVTAWVEGLGEVVLTEVELEDKGLEQVFDGFGQELLIRLLVARGPVPLDRLRETLAQVVADHHGDGEAAWAAAGDPVAGVLGVLADYGAVEAGNDAARLTPLGVLGVAMLADDEGHYLDARPPTESMSAAEAIMLSTSLPEDDAKEEFDAWLALRPRAKAAEELLGAAAGLDIVNRVEAVRRVNELWPDSEPALRGALGVPGVRPYAAAQLQQHGAAGGADLTRADMQWMTLDVWKISLGLGDDEFVSGLGSAPELTGFLDDIWRVPHPDVVELLEAVARLHPDKAVTKAARRALFRARSRAKD